MVEGVRLLNAALSVLLGTKPNDNGQVSQFFAV